MSVRGNIFLVPSAALAAGVGHEPAQVLHRLHPVASAVEPDLSFWNWHAAIQGLLTRRPQLRQEPFVGSLDRDRDLQGHLRDHSGAYHVVLRAGEGDPALAALSSLPFASPLVVAAEPPEVMASIASATGLGELEALMASRPQWSAAALMAAMKRLEPAFFDTTLSKVERASAKQRWTALQGRKAELDPDADMRRFVAELSEALGRAVRGCAQDQTVVALCS